MHEDHTVYKAKIIFKYIPRRHQVLSSQVHPIEEREFRVLSLNQHTIKIVRNNI